MSECNKNNNKSNGCQENGSCNKNCCNIPSTTLIRGIVALCFGLFFLALAYRIILRVIFFIVGLSLIYYGFRVLGCTQVTEAVENLIIRIRKLFNE